MEDTSKRMPFLKRCTDHFKREGEKKIVVGREVRDLTPRDKLDLWMSFNDASMPTDPPKGLEEQAAAMMAEATIA